MMAGKSILRFYFLVFYEVIVRNEGQMRLGRLCGHHDRTYGQLQQFLMHRGDHRFLHSSEGHRCQSEVLYRNLCLEVQLVL